MTRDEIRSGLEELLADILDLDELTLSDEMKADDVEGWDSLNHVRLIIAAENEFGIQFEVEEATTPENVGALIDLVASKL